MKFEVHDYPTERFTANKSKSKKEILQDSIGVYALKSISGLLGANTLFETEKVNKNWQSGSSSISVGMREQQDHALASDDIKLLNSMRIEVDTALTIKFFAREKLLLEIPFKEAGMQYRMNKPHSSVLDDELKNYSPATTFVDKNLYLAALDNIDFSDTISPNNFLIVNDGIVTLSYSLENDSFEIKIQVAACCDNNTLTFAKP